MNATTTRRTQAERRATTRRILLDAAADSVVAHGLAGLSIAAVAERAGLSTGAVFHHFPDKAALIKAMSEHISTQVTARFAASLPELIGLSARLHAAIDATMRSYEDPWLLASFEFLLASRTDQDLADHLVKLGEQEGEEHVAILRNYLHSEADVSAAWARPVIELTVFAIQGLAVTQLRGRDEPMRERMRALLGELVDGYAVDSLTTTPVARGAT